VSEMRPFVAIMLIGAGEKAPPGTTRPVGLALCSTANLRQLGSEIRSINAISIRSRSIPVFRLDALSF